ncbi:MAG TPA: ATP phosphoribosyltransferase, partial [Methanomicrobiales archaeon]|nr:ATP phosphoribosyltransferase [Methanomicrobiales archaeon]
RLIARTLDESVEILYARPIDIPEYVSNGAADMGITGHDMVVERRARVEELLDLQFGRATVVLAVPDESGIEEVQQLKGARIATEFPVITEDFFRSRGVHVDIVPVGGACEAAPLLGIADAIVDLTSSGSTLRMNHLHVLEEILVTSTHLIANPGSLQEKEEKIGEIQLALESVIHARGQRYLMMNVHRDALPEVEALLPGLSGPTVMEVASSEHLVAVHAVVHEERIYSLINQLKRAGARDILVIPIERMVR